MGARQQLCHRARGEQIVPLPIPPRSQAINALAGPHYENAKRQADFNDQLITALGPGTNISPASFALMGFGGGANVGATNGSFKRGNFTLTVGTSPSANPTLTLNIPKTEFGGQTPHIVLSQSGGTGTTGFGYSATAAAVTVKFNGTPSAGDTYTLNFQMVD